jgi:transcription elongation factor GreA
MRASNGSRGSSTACSPSVPTSSGGSRPRGSTATSRRTPNTTRRARIKALEAKLKVAIVTEPTERGARVELGSHVRVEVDGDESVLQVVGSAEANSREGRISSVSPVGAALMGRRVGDAVTIVTPGGEIRYQVLGIE